MDAHVHYKIYQLLALFSIFLCSYFYTEKYIVINNEESRISETIRYYVVRERYQLLSVYLEIYQPLYFDQWLPRLIIFIDS